MANTTRTARRSDVPREDGLGEEIQKRLQEELHVHIVAAATDDAIFLDGSVSTPEMRERVEHMARDLAPGKRIENNLEVEQLMTATEANPREEAGEVLDETNANTLRDEDAATLAEQQDAANTQAHMHSLPDYTDELDDPALIHASSGMDASLADQPLETNITDVVDESIYDEDDPAEPDPTYFAPTDPVVGSDAHGTLEVINGLGATAMDTDEVDVSASDNRPGDEALADAIRRELREDATTTELKVQVEVTDGVALLRGSVPTVEDAENAEWIASEVPGVIDVDEHLDVQSL